MVPCLARSSQLHFQPCRPKIFGARRRSSIWNDRGIARGGIPANFGGLRALTSAADIFRRLSVGRLPILQKLHAISPSAIVWHVTSVDDLFRTPLLRLSSLGNSFSHPISSPPPADSPDNDTVFFLENANRTEVVNHGPRATAEYKTTSFFYAINFQFHPKTKL